MQELQIFIPQTMNNLIFNSILILFAMLYLNLILFTMLYLSLNNRAFGQVAKIPFEFYQNRYVLINLRVNDSKDTLNFYFDTGATSTLIDSTTAINCGLKPNYEQNVSGAGGSKTYKIALSQTIVISDKVKIANTHVILDNLSRLQKSLGKKFDGIIGYSILKDYKTRIDFDNKVIELYSFDADIDTNGYETLDFVFAKNIPIPQFPISIELKNGKQFSDTILFDSGAGLSLLVNTPYKIKNKLINIVGKSITRKSENLSSESLLQEATIKSLQIGKFKFGEMPITFSSDQLGVSSYEGYLGILGNEIISRFNFISDYQNKKLYLKPGLRYKNDFEFEVSGVRLELDNKTVIVSSIIRESEAYLKGLRENHIIISINDITTTDIEVYRQLLKKEGGKVKIKFSTQGGAIKEISITLKRII